MKVYVFFVVVEALFYVLFLYHYHLYFNLYLHYLSNHFFLFYLLRGLDGTIVYVISFYDRYYYFFLTYTSLTCVKESIVAYTYYGVLGLLLFNHSLFGGLVGDDLLFLDDYFLVFSDILGILTFLRRDPIVLKGLHGALYVIRRL